jgi:hypothetical protein
LEDCATTEKIIFIPTLKPLAQGGVVFPIFTPHLAPIFKPFCQRSILAHRWRI